MNARPIPNTSTPAPVEADAAIPSRSEPSNLRGLFVLNGLEVGGSETKIVRAANALRRRGITTAIACLNTPGQLLEAVDPEVTVYCLQRRGKLSPAAVRNLRRLIEERQPNVVLSVNLYPAMYVSLATLSMRERPRIVGMMNTTVFSRRDAWRPRFYRPFLSRLDEIVYGCELQKEIWKAHLGALKVRSSVVYNGVDTDRFSVTNSDLKDTAERRRYGISERAFVIGTVGRLAAAKNQAVLIDTLVALRERSIDAHLLLVGEGERREALKERVAQRGVGGYVTFAGVLRDVRPALAAMDVFVLPSASVETFSNAALEAMAMSRPVILSKIGGAAEMVRDGVDGFVLEIDELAPSLPRLLDKLHSDAALRQRIGLAARERVSSRFSLGAMIERYESLLSVGTMTEMRAGEAT